MSGIRLQIIDSSEAFCKAVIKMLPDAFETDFFTDGRGAATRICSFRPDILVLAASLPGDDGFHILSMVQGAGIHSMVLMILPVITDYAKEQALAHNVDYAMCMPCSLQTVLSHILNFKDRLIGEKKSVETLSRSFLMDLNFRSNLCGYKYLLTAMPMLWKDPDQYLSKELYIAVAKYYNGTWQQIERGIRRSIEDAWESGEGEGWALYFPYQEAKPTNSELFARYIAYLQELITDNG